MKTRKKTACNRDCPDGCGVIATIDKGRIVRLQGDPDHPVTRGFLCHRTSRFLERQYDSSRITEAMIRSNKKSENWQTVRMSDALDLVAEKLLSNREQHGPASILNYRCGGSMGMMKYVTDYFFQKFGPVTIKSGDICAGAGDWAQEKDFGTQDSNDIFDLLNAKNIILWGKNVYVSQVHLLPILKQAKSKGARLILIDPIKHRTASICDQYISIEPGGDAALAFGMAKWLDENDRLDPEFGSYCDNVDEYLSLIRSHSVAEWSTMAKLDENVVSELASVYSSGPSSIVVGWGMQRRRNGAAIIRAIDALGAVSGNIGNPGAGISYYFPRKGAFDLSFLDETTAPRKIPEPLLGQGIESASDPPINMVFVSAANPVTNLPDSHSIRSALHQRFTVVVDMFMTDTAQCADVFLPTVTMLEDSDLIGAYGHHYLNRVEPVIDAPGEALTDYEIIREIASRVGLQQEFSEDALQWQKRMATGLSQQGIPFESLGAEVVRNPNAGKVVFANRVFATPSGKANLIQSYDHPDNQLDSGYPLRLMALATDQCQAAQWPAEQQAGAAELRIHPDAANGFSDGETVQVCSAMGSLKMKLRLNTEQRGDLAVTDKGGWLSAGRCANSITNAEESDQGGCAVYYDTPIRITKNPVH